MIDPFERPGSDEPFWNRHYLDENEELVGSGELMRYFSLHERARALAASGKDPDTGITHQSSVGEISRDGKQVYALALYHHANGIEKVRELVIGYNVDGVVQREVRIEGVPTTEGRLNPAYVNELTAAFDAVESEASFDQLSFE